MRKIVVTIRHVTPKPRLFNTKYNIVFGPVRFGPKVIKCFLMTLRDPNQEATPGRTLTLGLTLTLVLTLC